MKHMFDNDECPSGNFGDSQELTNWILGSGVMYYMTPEVSDFIPVSLEDTDKKLNLRTDIKSQRNKKDKYE